MKELPGLLEDENVRPEPPRPIPDLKEFPLWLEGWRMLLWDKAYVGAVFSGANAFRRDGAFSQHFQAEQAVNRLLYR